VRTFNLAAAMIRLSVCAGALGAASIAIASAVGGGQQATRAGSAIQRRQTAGHHRIGPRDT
jgi:hypothetical protein